MRDLVITLSAIALSLGVLAFFVWALNRNARNEAEKADRARKVDMGEGSS